MASRSSYTLNLDGTNETCITCGQPGNNDGARWRPVTGDVILFVSTSSLESSEFGNPPAGYTTELTLMDADGTNLRQLTFDNQVVADNQWSADGKRIIFRQSTAQVSRIRLLTFDDCLF
jgi:Tol biopolymer transport system component